MGFDPIGSEDLSAVRSFFRRFPGDGWQVLTDFIPESLTDLRGRRAFFASDSSAFRSRQAGFHL
jgi:hypothetical protein